MKLLIDTNVFLWVTGVERMTSESTRRMLKGKETEVHFSVLSAWEIAIMWAKGRLDLPERPCTFVEKVIAAGNMKRVPITFRDAYKVSELPRHHKDPFDRLLIAQAGNNNLTVLTADRAFEAYDIDVILCSAET